MKDLYFFLAMSRAFDLLTTYLLTPDLSKLELNPIVRFLGWKWNILLNIVVVIVLPLWAPLFTILFTVLSFLAGAWNLSRLMK